MPLHPFHRLVYANALLFPVKGTETFEAAANLFCRLLRNWPNAVFLKRALAEDLSVPFGHDSGLEPYLEQLALVKHEENDNVEDDRSPRVTGLPTPFRLPMFPSNHRRAADTRFIRGRELMPTAWAAGFLRAPRTVDLSRWLSPIPAWEPRTGLWVATRGFGIRHFWLHYYISHIPSHALWIEYLTRSCIQNQILLGRTESGSIL